MKISSLNSWEIGDTKSQEPQQSWEHEMVEVPPLGTQALVISSRGKFSQLANFFQNG